MYNRKEKDLNCSAIMRTDLKSVNNGMRFKPKTKQKTHTHKTHKKKSQPKIVVRRLLSRAMWKSTQFHTIGENSTTYTHIYFYAGTHIFSERKKYIRKQWVPNNAWLLRCWNSFNSVILWYQSSQSDVQTCIKKCHTNTHRESERARDRVNCSGNKMYLKTDKQTQSVWGS